MPRVSVIVPNYNHARYLEQRIDSVLNQTYQDFELILLDDQSQDNSKEILEKYRNHEKTSQLIFNDVNSGSTFKQWAKGISQATGELIWIAESDDYAHPTFLETMVASFDNPKVILSYSNSNIIDESSNIMEHSDFWKERYGQGRWNSDYTNNGNKEVSQYLKFKNTIPNASAVTFRKSSIDLRFLEDINMRYSGDWMCWMNIIGQGDIFYSGKKLNYFRHHERTTRHEKSHTQFMQHTIERLKVLKNATSFKERISEMDKLDWLVFHWLKRTPKRTLHKYLFPPFPIDLLLRFWYKLLLLTVYRVFKKK